MVHIEIANDRVRCIDIHIRLNPYKNVTYTYLSLHVSFSYGGQGRDVPIDLDSDVKTQLVSLKETIDHWQQWLSGYECRADISLEQLTEYVETALTSTPIFDRNFDCPKCYAEHKQYLYEHCIKYNEEGTAESTIAKELAEHVSEVTSAFAEQPNHKFKLPPF